VITGDPYKGKNHRKIGGRAEASGREVREAVGIVKDLLQKVGGGERP